MDAERFDALARDMSTPDTRRALLRLVAALPLAGLLSGLLGRATSEADGSGAIVGGGGRRRHRRKRHHRHQRHQRHKRHHCPKSCGPCQSCQQGKCQPDPDGSACGGGTCCDGKCVDLNTHPRNCGACGRRCQINGVCEQGQCGCIQGCDDYASGFQCCPAIGPSCSCGLGQYTDPLNCNVDIPEENCPPEQRCIGPFCKTCCPPDSTCDPSTGTCLQ
jgi:hypothetical protein